jgi:hypothetical protein
MSVKSAGVGKFTIPTAPAAGTSCASGAANVFTTTYVQLIASTGAAIYITGLFSERGSASPTYSITQLATGAAASETIVGQILSALQPTIAGACAYTPIFPPIPVATGTRIACKTADSAGALATLITLECINQSNVVDDGIAVGTVTTVTNQLTAAQIATGVWTDAVAGDFTAALSIGKSVVNGVALGTGLTINAYTGNTIQTGDAFARIGVNGAGLSNIGTIATCTNLTNLPAVPTDWLAGAGVKADAVTKIQAGLATPTNITGGIITTVTNLTNAPTAGDLTATMKTSVTTAATAATPVATVSGDLSATMKTSVTTACTASTPTAAAVTGAVGSVTAVVSANITKVNNVTVNGVGTAGNPWGP